MTPVDMRQALKETWLELAIGVTAKLDNKVDGHLEFTRTTGNKANTPWQLNLGARGNF
jgi:outer membrane autotransporter protein